MDHGGLSAPTAVRRVSKINPKGIQPSTISVSFADKLPAGRAAHKKGEAPKWRRTRLRHAPSVPLVPPREESPPVASFSLVLTRIRGFHAISWLLRLATAAHPVVVLLLALLAVLLGTVLLVRYVLLVGLVRRTHVKAEGGCGCRRPGLVPLV